MRVASRVGWGLVLACSLALGAEKAPPSSIKPAPAFKPSQLTALPTNAWITNGGTLFNQRYSPLTQLNRDNIAGLKALWRTGMGSAMDPGHAGQAQILVYDGVLYVPNGADRKSTRLNSSHLGISYAVFCLKKKKKN